MKAKGIVNKLLEDDEYNDPEHYLTGVVGDDTGLWDMDQALHNRGFKFVEYDGTPPVLVNRWIYNRNGQFWVINPLYKEDPFAKWFNIQRLNDAGMSAKTFTGVARDVLKYFDRERNRAA